MRAETMGYYAWLLERFSRSEGRWPTNIEEFAAYGGLDPQSVPLVYAHPATTNGSEVIFWWKGSTGPRMGLTREGRLAMPDGK